MKIAVCIKRVPDMEVRFRIAASGKAVDDAGVKYDMGDFDTSLLQAEEFLRQEPGNAYVKRVAVVSACAVDDPATARKHYQDMDAQNQRIVARRCERFGVRL